MGKVHDRILTLAVTADESDDSLLVTAVTYYRTRQDYTEGNGFSLTYTAGSASASAHEVEMGELLPPPTHIILIPTFQA